MFVPHILVVCFLLASVNSASGFSGEQIGTFFNNVGKGVEQWASDLSDDVRGWAMDNNDLTMKLRSENDAAIEAYKRGEINDEQLRTRVYINNYEYQQAINDRIRQQINRRR